MKEEHFDHFFHAKVLQSRLYNAWDDEGKTLLFCNTEISKKVSEGILQEILEFRKSVYPSCKSKLDEQSGIQLNDTLLFLSCAFSSRLLKSWSPQVEIAMSYLRQSLLPLRSMFKPSDTIQAAWRSVGSEWQKSIILGRWYREPPLQRVVDNFPKQPKRVDRIKCLGNAVVPIQAQEAFKRLMGLTSA